MLFTLAVPPFTVIGTVKADSQLGFNFGNGNAYVPERVFVRKLDVRPTVEAFAVQLDFSIAPEEVVRHLKHRLTALRGAEDFFNGKLAKGKLQLLRRPFCQL